MVQASKKGALKIKTLRMKPQSDPAFPIPMWQTPLERIQTFATTRDEELKSQQEGDEAATAKIEVCKKRIKDIE